MSKEIINSLQTKSVSPHLAFFLDTLAAFPNSYLKADKKRGGLTSIGQAHFTYILWEKMKNILGLIKEDPFIKAQAEQYKKETWEQTAEGTCSYSLSDQEREEFLSFLEQNHCELDGFLQETISTEMII